MKRILFFSVLPGIFILISAFIYLSKPWKGKMQEIPGKVECEFYDLGGEGEAYHDMDELNNGSGKLNPVNGNWLNEFRMNEGVDISYTKRNRVDENAFNKVNPKMDQLYIGWTQPGEWINYTVKVNEAGVYRISTMYTANRDGKIGFSVDGKSIAKNIKIPSTYDESDTVTWRQWHHWNMIDSLTEIKMSKGVHVLTLHIEEEGNMNFDFLEWRKKK